MPKPYQRRTSTEWIAIIEDQLQSVLSASQYCEQNQLSSASFYKWKQRYSTKPRQTVRLQCDEVDLLENVLTISKSKGWYQRIVPISTSTARELGNYRKRRIQANPISSTGAFFEFDNQQALSIQTADYAFKVLREVTAISNNLNGRLPRLYDLRHTFVCQRVLAWYKDNEDINNKVIQLSRYLGHKNVSDTYWYITAIPQLMAIASARFGKNNKEGGTL